MPESNFSDQQTAISATFSSPAFQENSLGEMSGPIQLEGYNTQLAAIVQSVLAVREHGHTDASATGPTDPWFQNGSPRSAQHDPAEAHHLRESLLAHLSQLQTLLFLDEPSVFLQSLAKKVFAIYLPHDPRGTDPRHEPLLIRRYDYTNRLRSWPASAGSRNSRYLLASPGKVACRRRIYVSLCLCPRVNFCLWCRQWPPSGSCRCLSPDMWVIPHCLQHS